MKTKKRSGVELRRSAVIVTVQGLDPDEPAGGVDTASWRAIRNWLRKLADSLVAQPPSKVKRARNRLMWDSVALFGDTQLPKQAAK
jgi:hypothetical protein